MDTSQGQEQQLTKRQRRALKKLERAAANKASARWQSLRGSILWLLALVVAVGIIIAIVWAGQRNGGAKVSTTGSVTPTATDWSTGNADASVTLIEYSDFQCPACAFYYPIVKRLKDEEGAKFRLIYRNFPLKTLHKNAEPAALAAEAAGNQGKFWQMHDLLFENQKSWESLGNPDEAFIGYAQQLELDATRFSEDYKASATADRVQEDVQSGNAASVDATPTFFLNGTKVENPPSNYEGLKKLLDDAVTTNP